MDTPQSASVREWCDSTQVSPHAALTHLLARGGFPEPALADNDADAQRWRTDYFAGLVRECKAEADIGRLQIRDAAPWLAGLDVQEIGR